MHRVPVTNLHARKGQAGFSLVEVLVAIALLVVGIVAIISLFPPGFQAMDNAQTRTAVQQAGTNELSRAQSELGQIALIYSEYNATTDDTTWNVNVGNLPTIGYADGGINTERMVSGEQFQIPAPSATGTSTYMTTFGPIVIPGNTNTGQVSVRGTPWQAITANDTQVASPNSPMPPQDDPDDALTHDQPQYLVDYVNGRLAIPLENTYYQYNQSLENNGSPSTPTGEFSQLVNVSIWALVPGSTTTYHEFSTQFTYDPTMTLFMYASPSPSAGTGGDGLYHTQWFDPTAIPGVTWKDVTANTAQAGTSEPGAPWENATATLSRDYAFVPPAGSFTADPFQYTVDTNPGGLGGNVNVGALHFPPQASAMRNAQGNPVTAMVDYTVADWHILREDVVANAAELRLAVPAVLEDGDQMELGAPYSGLLTGTGLATGSVDDIFIYDVDHATKLSSTGDYSLSYNTGRLTLLGTYPTSNARLRIYYRARHQWGFGVTKAASSYTYGGVFSSSASPTLATYYVNSSTGPTQLYFPFTDNGKTVSLTNVQVTNGTPSQNETISHGGAWQILSETVGGVQVGYIDLTTSRVSDGNPPGIIPSGYTLNIGTTSAPVMPVSTVTGTSSMLRAVYYDQNSIRHQDITSYANP